MGNNNNNNDDDNNNNNNNNPEIVHGADAEMPAVADANADSTVNHLTANTLKGGNHSNSRKSQKMFILAAAAVALSVCSLLIGYVLGATTNTTLFTKTGVSSGDNSNNNNININNNNIADMTNAELMNLKEVVLSKGDIKFNVKGYARKFESDSSSARTSGEQQQTQSSTSQEVVVLLVEGGTLTFDSINGIDISKATGDALYLLQVAFVIDVDDPNVVDVDDAAVSRSRRRRRRRGKQLIDECEELLSATPTASPTVSPAPTVSPTARTPAPISGPSPTTTVSPTTVTPSPVTNFYYDPPGPISPAPCTGRACDFLYSMP